MCVFVCVRLVGEFCKVKGFVVTVNDSAGPHAAPVDGPITFKCVWFHIPESTPRSVFGPRACKCQVVTMTAEAGSVSPFFYIMLN